MSDLDNEMKNKLIKDSPFLLRIAHAQLPRILTQICRDPGSPFYGSCDRNWWHYKIRDFPSIILQQAGYTISVAGKSQWGTVFSSDLLQLASASCRFWNKRVLCHGAFEEYYPYEQGYPPLAFSTLAVSKMCNEGVCSLVDVNEGLEIATGQLLKRQETKALNQQVAGVAALAVIRSINPSIVPEKDFHKLLDRTLDTQTEEGWFPEYDGPDLGYLSVTMDCLWDLYDLTSDQRCHDAILKAFDYICWFVRGPLKSAGMHNSRNTDYILPYGIVRLGMEESEIGREARLLSSALYGKASGKNHFLFSIDDRYWCHYFGHSVYRAVQLLEKVNYCVDEYEESPKGFFSSQKDEKLQSGHFLLFFEKSKSYPQILVSGKKGAIFSATWADGREINDFGWVLKRGEKVFVSHWWSLEWDIPLRTQRQIKCEGFMVAHKERISTPWKHMALRIMSFLFGMRIINLLKRLMIFKKFNHKIRFQRTINCKKDCLEVDDLIDNIKRTDTLLRAPRSSKRHVASADSFHKEDFVLIDGIVREEFIINEGRRIIVKTRYKPK